MARDIVPLDPWQDKCPWCGKPILVDHQLAVYDDGESEQFVGLRRDGVTPDYGLSQRELEVLPLIIKGLKDKEIADALKVSANTAKQHLANIHHKLGTRNRTETAIKAVREGLV